MADDKVTRRDFVRTGAAAGLTASVGASAVSASESETASQAEQPATDQGTLANGMPYGKIGDLKISRLIFGSNTPGLTPEI